VQLWIPYIFPPEFRNVRGAHFLNIYARLRPGVSQAEAQAEMDSLAAQLESENPQVNRGHGANVVPLREDLVRKIQPALLLLLGAVGFVLLIACANVANLLLAHGARRQKELAIRAAVGAGRFRLVRQLITESLLLAMMGGALAVVLALWAMDAVRGIIPPDIPVIGLREFGLDFKLLLFLFGTSVATGILFGVAPALLGTGIDLNDSLKEGGRSSATSRRASWVRNGLVVTEVALSVILLAGAGLMVRTIVSLQQVQPGFRPQGVLTMGLSLPTRRYSEPHQQAAFYRQLLENIRAVPGVESAGVISFLPLSEQDARTDIEIEGRESNPDEPTRAHHRFVSPDYFKTLGIPLLEGRFLRESDTREAPAVVLINHAAAGRYWPGDHPVGRRLRHVGTDEWREIVGVVGDVKHWGLDSAVKPEMYLPVEQLPLPYPRTNIILRGRPNTDPIVLAAALKSEVRRLDSDLSAGQVRSLEEVINVWYAPRRFLLILLAAFAGIAVSLAAVGLYGVLAFSVAQRTHEIGVRRALGAQSADIFGLVIGRGISLVVVGLGLGVAGALALTRFMASVLFQVKPTDPVTFFGVGIVLLVVALLACYLPARRATRVDPMTALRYE